MSTVAFFSAIHRSNFKQDFLIFIKVNADIGLLVAG